MILWLLACAMHPAVPLGPVERIDAFAIEARGQTMAGMALVASDAEQITLQALTPVGNAMFTVSVVDHHSEVDSPQPDLALWLGRMPFARDLSALYRYECTQRCKAGAWTLISTDNQTKIRGPGGRATLRTDDSTWVLSDLRRGYTLTVFRGAE